jgi:hypothetical protein
MTKSVPCKHLHDVALSLLALLVVTFLLCKKYPFLVLPLSFYLAELSHVTLMPFEYWGQSLAIILFLYLT